MIIQKKEPLDINNPSFNIFKLLLRLIKFSSYALLLIVAISMISNKLALDWRIGQYSTKINKILFGYNHEFMISNLRDTSSYFKGFLSGKMSRDGLIHIDLSIEHDKLLNIYNESINSKPRNYYSAKLSIRNQDNKEKLKLKVRGKGDRPLHYEDITSMSFRSNLKGDSRLFGIEKFSIQNPLLRNYSWEYLISKIVSDQSLLTIRSWQVNFSVNGDDKGIYTIEEVPSKETIEQQKRKNGPIFGIEESISTSLNTKLDPYELKDWQNTDLFNHSKELLYSSFRDALNGKVFSSDIFDFQEWAKYFALMDFFGSYHGSLPKSVKFYFNPVIGKFQPLLFDAHIGAGDFKDFALLDFISDIDQINCEYLCERDNFYKAFLNNKEFFSYYIKYLEEYSSIDFLDEVKDSYVSNFKKIDNEFYSKLSPSDQIFSKGLSPYYFKFDRINYRNKMLNNKVMIFLDSYAKSSSSSSFNTQSLNKLSIPDNVKLVQYSNFNFKGTEINIVEPTIFIFDGNSSIQGISKKQMLYIKGPGMFIFESGNTFIKDVVFESPVAIKIANRNLSGSINIIQSDTQIDNLKIINSNAEDAINIVSSPFLIKSLYIDSSFSDAIDLDFSRGEIKKLNCNNIGNDCLDISESEVSANEIIVTKTQDKAISVGENSTMKADTIIISDSAIGLVSKDGSSLEVKNAQVINVQLPIAVFKKKPSYGEPSIFINSITSDQEIFGLFEKDSKVLVGNNVTKKILKSAQIEELLYGAVYGKATNK